MGELWESEFCECYTCNGSGKILLPDDIKNPEFCWNCHGSGYIWPFGSILAANPIGSCLDCRQLGVVDRDQHNARNRIIFEHQ